MEISFQDLLRKFKEVEAKEFPLRKIATIEEETQCFDIFTAILDQDFAILKVKNKKNKDSGFITLRDILGLFIPTSAEIHAVLSSEQVLSSIRAIDLAKTHLPVVYDDSTLSEIAGLMIKYETNFLPRADSKKESEIKGLILLRDIIAGCRKIKQQYEVYSEDAENGDLS